MKDPESHTDFYKSTLESLLADGTLTRTSKVLVICGGDTDREVFESLGFKDVTVSNLSLPPDKQGTSPLASSWARQDAERLSYPDNTFDIAVVHSGLHHLRCPQKAIGEMYRVASRGILGFEPARNLFTALGVKMGIGQQYEIAAVCYNNYKAGGVADSRIPNYVYRFSKTDIIRTVQALAPVASHRYRFWYATRLPGSLKGATRRGVRLFVDLLAPLLTLVGRMFPFLANNIAFFVAKPTLPNDLFPWLCMEGNEIAPRREYIEKIYK